MGDFPTVLTTYASRIHPAAVALGANPGTISPTLATLCNTILSVSSDMSSLLPIALSFAFGCALQLFVLLQLHGTFSSEDETEGGMPREVQEPIRRMIEEERKKETEPVCCIQG